MRLLALARTFALGAAVSLLGASASNPQAQLQYFVGTWTCGGSTWTWSQLAPGSAWILNVYGDPKHPDGNAVVGYVASLHAFVYRDFHADGSYADLTTKGYVNGRWTFTGPYYPKGAAKPLAAHVVYTVVNREQYDRAFLADKAGKLTPMSDDHCVRVER